jgi:prevent-host-death family protein
MKTVNIQDAKTHLSKLIDAAVKGEPFIIAKAGKPMVKVVPIDAPKARTDATWRTRASKDRAPRPNTCAAIVSACSDL